MFKGLSSYSTLFTKLYLLQEAHVCQPKLTLNKSSTQCMAWSYEQTLETFMLGFIVYGAKQPHYNYTHHFSFMDGNNLKIDWDSDNNVTLARCKKRTVLYCAPGYKCQDCANLPLQLST